MVFTNPGKALVALGLGSDVGLFIGFIGIGSGSGTASVTNTTLLAERERNAITGSPNFATTQKVAFQGDFSATQMSGTDLTEFGLFNVGSATGFPGSVWQREAFGSIPFDGTNELQVEETWEIF